MGHRVCQNDFKAVESAHDYNIMLATREVFLFGEDEAAWDSDEPGVEFRQANRLVRNMRLLSAQNLKPILIHMKTCGGYWEEGMAIFEAVRQCPCHVTIVSYTHARSMSSVILQAADHRVLMPSSYFMFHYGTLGADGNYKTVMAGVDRAKVETDMMLDIYLGAITRSKRPMWAKSATAAIRNRLRREMDRRDDVFLTADEAVAWGFADAVFDGDWGALLD